MEQARGLSVGPAALSKKSQGLFVDSTGISAPRTRDVTVIYGISEGKRGDDVVVILRSMYPGPDVGELKGDVSVREGRVFFDWNVAGDDGAQWGEP